MRPTAAFRLTVGVEIERFERFERIGEGAQSGSQRWIGLERRRRILMNRIEGGGRRRLVETSARAHGLGINVGCCCEEPVTLSLRSLATFICVSADLAEDRGLLGRVSMLHLRAQNWQMKRAT